MTDERRKPIDPRWIVPSWNAPPTIRAVVTSRDGGLSRGPWGGSEGGGMNLGYGSGDERDTVSANRALFSRCLPAEPAWLKQVHGTAVVDASLVPSSHAGEADGSFTTKAGHVCVVLVADCMPVLFCDRNGDRVAVAHAGWRGLAAGVLEATIRTAGLVAAETMAWIGPAIGPTRFEVGADVRDAFVAAAGRDVAATAAALVPSAPGKWLADLPALASLRLAACGVTSIHRSGLCTASDPARFYSYRRDGTTGRMAAAIWIER